MKNYNNKRENIFHCFLDRAIKMIKIFVVPYKNIKEEQQESKENENMYPLW